MLKLTNRDIKNIIQFGFCNIFNFGIFFYRKNKYFYSRICIKVPKKVCLFSVNRSCIRRFIKYKFKSNIFILRGYDVVMIINCTYELYFNANSLYFL